MLIEVGSYLKITDPSPEIMRWCKENLVLTEPGLPEESAYALVGGQHPQTTAVVQHERQ